MSMTGGYDALDELYERLRDAEDAQRAGGITPETIRAARGGVADGYGRECHAVGENAADGDSAPLADVSRDSRERIEADLLALTETWRDHDGDFMKIYSSVAYAQIKELLDRQAALTEGDCAACAEFLGTYADSLCDPLKERIAVLEAELDHARSCPDCDCCGWKEKVDELRAELDKYKRHMWEYSMWHESTARMLGIGFDPENLPSDDEVQGEIERRICALQAKVDELQVELDDIDGETYFGATIEEWHELAVRMEAERDVLRAELDAYDKTHMLLPVDADGVPIKLGDKVVIPQCYEGIVVSIEVGDMETLIGVDGHDGYLRYGNSDIRHVEPRTVEDVLKEVMAETRLAVNPNQWIVEKYADELRELMGADE